MLFANDIDMSSGCIYTRRYPHVVQSLEHFVAYSLFPKLYSNRGLHKFVALTFIVEDYCQYLTSLSSQITFVLSILLE